MAQRVVARGWSVRQSRVPRRRLLRSARHARAAPMSRTPSNRSSTGPSPERFFEQCHRLLKPGGLLVICDDVRQARRLVPGSGRAVSRNSHERLAHQHTARSRDALVSAGSYAGFQHESTTDLTPFIEITRVRDRAIAACVALLRRLPFETGALRLRDRRRRAADVPGERVDRIRVERVQG